MKNLFKLFFLFFITMVVFFVQPSDFQLKEIQAEAAIQAVASENFVLVSNSFQSGEIYSYQEELSPNSLGNSPQALSFDLYNNNFAKNITHNYGSFIHNLSTNKQKVHQIRAP